MKEYMPCFSCEKEFNSYFKRETEICDKHRNCDGVLEFDTKADFENFLSELGMEVIQDNVGSPNIHTVMRF